jgi:hypothetical protein
VVDPLARHLGFLPVLLAERLGLGNKFLQRRDVWKREREVLGMPVASFSETFFASGRLCFLGPPL